MKQKIYIKLFGLTLILASFPLIGSTLKNSITRDSKVSIEDRINRQLLECPQSSVDPKLKLELILAFERIYINLHDFLLVRAYPQTFLSDILDSFLQTDLNNMIVLIETCNSAKFNTFLEEVNRYFPTIQSYLLESINRCNTPINPIPEAAARLFYQGDTLAEFFIHNQTLGCEDKKYIKALINALTASTIEMIDNLSPSCDIEGSPINAMASDRAYKRVRVLAGLLAIEVAKTFPCPTQTTATHCCN